MALRFRITLIAFLSALVVLTGQGMAMSRGMDRAADQIEICTGTGPVMIYVDADGQPTRPPHYCPEFALTLLAGLLATTQVVPLGPGPETPSPQAVPSSQFLSPVRAAAARAPPGFV